MIQNSFSDEFPVPWLGEIVGLEARLAKCQPTPGGVGQRSVRSSAVGAVPNVDDECRAYGARSLFPVSHTCRCGLTFGQPGLRP